MKSQPVKNARLEIQILVSLYRIMRLYCLKNISRIPPRLPKGLLGTSLNSSSPQSENLSKGLQ
jgi:hypothetical protein